MPTPALRSKTDLVDRVDVGIGPYGRGCMKKVRFPALMVLLAVLGFGLRWLVYATAVDGKNLIVGGHPAVIALWVLTAAALALAAYGARKEPETAPSYAGHAPAFLGHGLLGVAIGMTVLLNPLPMPGPLALIWKVLGLAAPVCLLAAGFERMRGKVPFFALYAAPSLFFTVHVVAHYQRWCANPQFTDYAFALLASVALALNCYQHAAFGADMGRRKMLTLTALAAVYLCGAEMASSLYPYLYLGGALFCLTDSNP